MHHIFGYVRSVLHATPSDVHAKRLQEIALEASWRADFVTLSDYVRDIVRSSHAWQSYLSSHPLVWCQLVQSGWVFEPIQRSERLCVVEVLDTTALTESIHIGEGEQRCFSFGRRLDNTLHLPYPVMGRRHAEASFEPARDIIRVVHLGSSNGLTACHTERDETTRFHSAFSLVDASDVSRYVFTVAHALFMRFSLLDELRVGLVQSSLMANIRQRDGWGELYEPKRFNVF